MGKLKRVSCCLREYLRGYEFIYKYCDTFVEGLVGKGLQIRMKNPKNSPIENMYLKAKHNDKHKAEVTLLQKTVCRHGLRCLSLFLPSFVSADSVHRGGLRPKARSLTRPPLSRMTVPLVMQNLSAFEACMKQACFQDMLEAGWFCHHVCRPRLFYDVRVVWTP